MTAITLLQARPTPIILTLAITALASANWLHPLVRFSWAPANPAFMGLVFLLPILALVLAFRLPNRRVKWLAVACLFPVALLGALLAILASAELAFALQGGFTNGLRPTDRLDVPGGRLMAYDTNCGAPCDYGLLVRQESSVVPGIILVRRLLYLPHSVGGRFERAANDDVRVITHIDGVDGAGPALERDGHRWQVRSLR